MGFTSIKGGYVLCACMALLFSAPVYATPLAQLMNDFGVQQPKVHKPAPGFSLPDLNGEQTSLSDQRGKLVLLHFGATWCVPCRHELPLLQTLDKQAIDGLRIVSINVNRGTQDTVKTFIRDVTPGFQTLLDPDGTVRHQYAIRGLPTTYLIDPAGNIIGRIIGERDWSSPAMQDILQRLVQR